VIHNTNQSDFSNVDKTFFVNLYVNMTIVSCHTFFRN